MVQCNFPNFSGPTVSKETEQALCTTNHKFGLAKGLSSRQRAQKEPEREKAPGSRNQVAGTKLQDSGSWPRFQSS